MNLHEIDFFLKTISKGEEIVPTFTLFQKRGDFLWVSSANRNSRII